MSRNVSVTEPHPTVPKSGAYLLGGRGGAGNYKHYSSSEITAGPTATGPASRLSLSRSAATHRTLAAGRGGAGNMFTPTEPPVFHFDEEMLKRREAQPPVYHTGRGGAANFVNESKPATTRTGSSSSASSTSSAGSLRRDLNATVGRLSRKISGF